VDTVSTSSLQPGDIVHVVSRGGGGGGRKEGRKEERKEEKGRLGG